jgi:outer membrane protein assembly factor BamB
VRVSNGAKVVSASLDAYTAASAGIVAGVAYFGTFSNEVLAFDIASRKVLWRFSDPERQFAFYSSAAVSANAVVIGGRDKTVRALDRTTGKVRWSFLTRARVDSSPAIAGNRVVVGSSDGKVYVLDLVSGKSVWEFEAGAAITASPAVADGRIVIGDTDGRIYGIGR